YIFNDRMMLACGAAQPDDCALSVYATVVSRAAPERGILDSGSKTLTADTGALDDGFGLILEYPQAKIGAFAEEHGFLDLARSNARPKVGEIVRVVPNHVCVVVNMVDRMIAVRGDRIVDVLPVAARGRLALRVNGACPRDWDEHEAEHCHHRCRHRRAGSCRPAVAA